MAVLTKNIKNAAGTLTEVDYFAADGQTLSKVDYYTNGQIQQELIYANNGKTVISNASFTYYKNTLQSSTIKSPDGKIQSLIQYSSDGKTVSQINNYAYDSNGNLTSISSTEANGQ